MRPTTVRTAIIVLGIWVFVSPFLWAHTLSQMLNGIVVGALMGIVAMKTERHPQWRYANVALAAWLMLATWWLPTFSYATHYNHLAVGLVVLLLSLPASIHLHRPADSTRR